MLSLWCVKLEQLARNRAVGLVRRLRSMLECWVDRGVTLVLKGFMSMHILVNPEGVMSLPAPSAWCLCHLCPVWGQHLGCG